MSKGSKYYIKHACTIFVYILINRQLIVPQSLKGKHIFILNEKYIGGSTYDCNVIMLGSKSDYNVSFNGIHILPQSILLGNKYDCKHWNVLLDEIRPDMRVRSAIFEMALIFVPYSKRLQSYFNPFVIRIAHIFGPQCDQDCSHTGQSSQDFSQNQHKN